MTNSQMCPDTFLGDNDKEQNAISDACIVAAAVQRKASLVSITMATRSVTAVHLLCSILHQNTKPRKATITQQRTSRQDAHGFV